MTGVDQKWFPAKRFGWGWGPPTRWQGWLVLAVYFALLAGGMLVLRERKATVHSVTYFAVITAALVAVCWWKGETPRWQWGKE